MSICLRIGFADSNQCRSTHARLVCSDYTTAVDRSDIKDASAIRCTRRLTKESGFRSVVINTEHEAFDRGLAAGLSRSLGGDVYTLRQLKVEEILETVRGELNLLNPDKK